MRLRLKETALWLVTILILNTTPAISQPQKPTMPEWLAAVKLYSAKYNVEPHLALALAAVESQNKGVLFRFGKLGKGRVYGPFGIHKCFLKRWDIDNSLVNTEVGIRAFGKWLAKYGNVKQALKKYNTEFSEDYYKEFQRLKKMFDEIKPFEEPGRLAQLR